MFSFNNIKKNFNFLFKYMKKNPKNNTANQSKSQVHFFFENR